jgi:hypothetical protein
MEKDMDILKKIAIVGSVFFLQVAVCYDVIRIGFAPHGPNDLIGKKLFKNDLGKYGQWLAGMGVNLDEDRIAFVDDKCSGPKGPVPPWYIFCGDSLVWNVSFLSKSRNYFEPISEPDFHRDGCADLVITDGAVASGLIPPRILSNLLYNPDLPESYFDMGQGAGSGLLGMCTPLRLGGKVVLTNLNPISSPDGSKIEFNSEGFRNLCPGGARTVKLGNNKRRSRVVTITLYRNYGAYKRSGRSTPLEEALYISAHVLSLGNFTEEELAQAIEEVFEAPEGHVLMVMERVEEE